MFSYFSNCFTVTPIQSVYITIFCWLSLSVHNTYGAAIQERPGHSLTDAEFESTDRHKRSTNGTLSPCFVIDTEAPVTPADFPTALNDLLNRVTGLQTSTSKIIQYVSTTSSLFYLLLLLVSPSTMLCFSTR